MSPRGKQPWRPLDASPVGRPPTDLRGHCGRTIPDREAAADVIQGVFAMEWRSAVCFDAERSAVATWLLVMARSRSGDALRKTRPTPAGDERENWVVVPAVPDDVAEEAAGRLEQEAVRHAMGGPPAHQREALTMVYLEGLSGQEAPRRHQVPLGSPKARLCFGRGKLRDVLGGESDGSCRDSLPPLTPSQTYEGWWIVNGKPVAAGPVGQEPHLLTRPAVARARAVTVEPAGGASPLTTPCWPAHPCD